MKILRPQYDHNGKQIPYRRPDRLNLNKSQRRQLKKLLRKAREQG